MILSTIMIVILKQYNNNNLLKIDPNKVTLKIFTRDNEIAFNVC
jgi:hypothetical protein